MYNAERVEYLLKQDKTEDVVEELIKLNYGLVRKQLGKFYLTNDPDAISYGYEALYKAIMSFDPVKNNKFSTYATVCIYNRLGSHVRSLNTQIMQNTMSYEEPVGEDSRLIDLLESPITADGAILDECAVTEIEIAIIECYYNFKNETHKKILFTWIKSEYLKTQTTIAEEIGCSQTYVAQVIKKFKNMLKEKIK